MGRNKMYTVDLTEQQIKLLRNAIDSHYETHHYMPPKEESRQIEIILDKFDEVTFEPPEPEVAIRLHFEDHNKDWKNGQPIVGEWQVQIFDHAKCIQEEDDYSSNVYLKVPDDLEPMHIERFPCNTEGMTPEEIGVFIKSYEDYAHRMDSILNYEHYNNRYVRRVDDWEEWDYTY